MVPVDMLGSPLAVLAGVTKKSTIKIGRLSDEAEPPEANEVPVAASSAITSKSETFYEKANAYGGVRVSGYLTGVLGVWTSAIPSLVSCYKGSKCGAVVTRTGGGEVMVTVAERPHRVGYRFSRE